MIAAALQVPVAWVTVTDDAHRTYRARSGPVPGDLIIITDISRSWRFVPDLTTTGDGWLLIDACPSCGADVPTARIATLADLGDHLDPDHNKKPVHEFYTDPAHQPGCRNTLRGCQVFGVTVDFGFIGVRRTGVRRR
ncbi:hypothetical protein [Saccharopolyspora sp. ASAGF58]|uniref:hypothetical protein n=1 Tax=Saccharopolyspora sp. ASAGF58 TaxID=2719023 RepID=UPI001B30309D|nr:hypothetical protein [Saccharopolyspora sp. ASAGF58]